MGTICRQQATGRGREVNDAPAKESKMNHNISSMMTGALLAIASLQALPADCQAADGPPNILFILTDDQGYGDLSCYPIWKNSTLTSAPSVGWKAIPKSGPSRRNRQYGKQNQQRRRERSEGLNDKNMKYVHKWYCSALVLYLSKEFELCGMQNDPHEKIQLRREPTSMNARYPVNDGQRLCPLVP